MNPLIFFVIVIIIDLVLKSGKNKKKVEQARRQRTGEMSRTAPASKASKGKSIMQSIREEMEKEAQKASGKVVQKQPAKRMIQQKVYTEDQFITHDNSAELKEAEIKSRSKWTNDDIFEKSNAEEVIAKEKRKTSKGRKDALRSDVIKGIIFSEIISEPKSLKNQRESM